jgi:hypothetical protein
MKEKIKVGTVLIDDVRQLYEVAELWKNTCAVISYPNDGDFACEIMTYKGMENEGWQIVNSGA